jgi:nicotinamide-nucleotide amidase
LLTEIISIGTELILGNIVDTNSAYLAEQLTANGIDIHYMTTVGDNRERLVMVLQQALSRADIIITTGGLGPTDDDLTREAISDVTGIPLKKVPALARNIEEYFKYRQYSMTENNYKQACIPEGSQAIRNLKGTAPGIILEIEGRTIISLPGVPREMRAMVQDEVIPYLRKLTQEKIKSRVLNFFAIGESRLETMIKDILDRQTNPSLALLAGNGEVKIRITAKGSSDQEINQLIYKAEQEIRNRIDKYIYSVDDLELAVVTGKLLQDKGLTLSTAESCTGGLISHRITEVPGSSGYFTGGMVLYSNQAKIEQLGVKTTTLEKHGAVSEETVKEMAASIRQKMKTAIGLSVSGIAGPGGGTEEKPVGTVFIGLAADDENLAFKLNLKGDRQWNKWMSSQYALYYLFRYLKNK